MTLNVVINLAWLFYLLVSLAPNWLLLISTPVSNLSTKLRSTFWLFFLCLLKETIGFTDFFDLQFFNEFMLLGCLEYNLIDLGQFYSIECLLYFFYVQCYSRIGTWSWMNCYTFRSLIYITADYILVYTSCEPWYPNSAVLLLLIFSANKYSTPSIEKLLKNYKSLNSYFYQQGK